MGKGERTGRIGRLAYLAGYYLGTLAGKQGPLMGGVKLTHNCTLSCMHCPFRHRTGESLSFAQLLDSLDALHKWGVRILMYEGGEPFLWRDGDRDLHDAIAEAKERFFSVGVTTNGTFPIELNSDVVWVSVDGLRETHDRIRGRDCFERIVAHIEASTHPRLYAHITINALNWTEIPELVRFLAPRVRGVTVQFHYPFQEVEEELLLPSDQRRQVLDDLIRLKRQGLPVVNSRASLEALKDNRWKCRPWMIASVDPDGSLTHGCYLQNRGQISCAQCGFSVHTEISLAYSGVLESILVGNRVFSLV